MKTQITFQIKNLELDEVLRIGNFEFNQVSDYDSAISIMKKEKKDTITFTAVAQIEGSDNKSVDGNIKSKQKELNQITWILSFTQGIRISPISWNISPEIKGIDSGSFWPTKSAVIPGDHVISRSYLPTFIKHIAPKILDIEYLEKNKILLPIAFYLSGLEDNMMTNCFILPFISFESLVFYNTDEYIFGTDTLPTGLISKIKDVLENHSSFSKLSKERRTELLNKIFELKRRPIMSRVNDFMKTNNIFLKDYDYDIKTIFKVRNIIFHTGADIERGILLNCMKEIRSLVVRSILAKMDYKGKYNEIVKGWAEIEFP